MPTMDSGLMNPAKRFRRDGSLDTDGRSSDNSPESVDGQVTLNRKYSGSVKSGRAILLFTIEIICGASSEFVSSSIPS